MFNYYFIIKLCNYVRGKDIHRVSFDFDFTSYVIGLSDVASILARRVALEVSDSDDGPSDSEYDSDEWGKWKIGICVSPA